MDYSQIKVFSKKELMDMLPSWYRFKTDPWKHQVACTVASIVEGSFQNWLDLGTGKTKVAIDVCRYYHHSNRNLKILVVCLNSAVENWADEIAIHSDMKATCLQGTMEERWKKIKGHGFFIINFKGLMYLVTSKKKIKIRKKKGGREIDNKLMSKLLSIDFDVLIIDESHKMKDSRTLTYKIIKKIALRKNTIRLSLTGTPFGNSLLGIWSQYYITDFGETFTPNFSKFRNTYFENDEKKIGWGRTLRIIPNWIITEQGQKDIEQRLFNKALRYNESEVDDLPEKVYRNVFYKLSEEQKDFVVALYDPSVVKNFKNKIMVCRQICSGFIKSEDKVFKENPKLKMLEDIIEQVSGESKIVIFHEFIKEGLMIEQLLKRLKIKYTTLNGRVKDKHKQYKTFETNDSYRIMVAHPKSGGASINLVSATYCIFSSNGYSVIDRKQCEKRIHRAGQTSNRVFYYDLIGKDTVEESILESLKQGVNFFDKVIDRESYLKALKGKL